MPVRKWGRGPLDAPPVCAPHASARLPGAAGPAACSAATYYVAPTGNDTAAGTEAALTLGFVHPPAATDLTYQIQCSTDLLTWTDASRYGPLGDIPNTAFTVELSRLANATGETITVRSALPPHSPRAFLRLKVTAETTGP